MRGETPGGLLPYKGERALERVWLVSGQLACRRHFRTRRWEWRDCRLEWGEREEKVGRGKTKCDGRVNIADLMQMAGGKRWLTADCCAVRWRPTSLFLWSPSNHQPLDFLLDDSASVSASPPIAVISIIIFFFPAQVSSPGLVFLSSVFRSIHSSHLVVDLAAFPGLQGCVIPYVGRVGRPRFGR